ncbi:hypothetical protein A3860_17345 [Niastella vici]|uniref:Uncharacterized protein n=1 Tax=Niastella vici TaxID=1703345 RepID=A0A1V9G456_9BACT|nr:hypothetical protein [Niastella vici]OQP65429.1 hypothetical protein A3860_17345 [Niastella vici]
MTYTIKNTQDILNRLSSEDQIHCQLVFENYQNKLHLINSLLETIRDTTEKIEKRDKEEIQKIGEINDLLNGIIRINSESLVKILESYFITKYAISFSSYLNLKAKLSPFNSFLPIVSGIFSQCSEDLNISGSENIADKFQRRFYYQEEQPVINGEKICLPFYCCYNNYGHLSLQKDGEQSIKWLLHALCYCFLNTNSMPSELSTLYDQWLKEIDVKRTYIIFPGVTIKFFRNRKVNLSFSTPEHALKFWNHFELTGIAARMRTKNP